MPESFTISLTSESKPFRHNAKRPTLLASLGGSEPYPTARLISCALPTKIIWNRMSGVTVACLPSFSSDQAAFDHRYILIKKYFVTKMNTSWYTSLFVRPHRVCQIFMSHEKTHRAVLLIMSIGRFNWDAVIWSSTTCFTGLTLAISLPQPPITNH